MTTYQQKPPTIEAEFWDGNNINPVQSLCPEAYVAEEDETVCIIPLTAPMPGLMPVPANSYVTKDAWGNTSHSPKDAFEATYERATGPQ